MGGAPASEIIQEQKEKTLLMTESKTLEPPLKLWDESIRRYNVSFLVVILYYGCAKRYPWGKLTKDLCTISYNCM